MLQDLINPHDNLSGKHGDDVSNAIARCQADQHFVGTVVLGGGPSVGAGGGVVLRGSSGHWRAGGGVGVDAIDDAL